MSLTFSSPVVVTQNKSIDSFYRFDLGGGYFDGISPLKDRDDLLILHKPTSSGLVFDARPLRDYSVTRNGRLYYYSYNSLFLNGNPYFKEVFELNDNVLIGSGICSSVDWDTVAFSQDLSSLFSFREACNIYNRVSRGAYTRYHWGVVNDVVFYIERQYNSSSYLYAKVFQKQNDSLNYVTSKQIDIFVNTPVAVFDGGDAVYFAFVGSLKSIIILRYDNLDSSIFSYGTNSDLFFYYCFVPDEVEKCLYCLYDSGSVLKYTPRFSPIRFGIRSLPSLSSSDYNVLKEQGFIARAGSIARSNNKVFLLVAQYFKGHYRRDLSTYDINYITKASCLMIYDITNVSNNSSLSPVGRLFLPKNHCIRGVLKLTDSSFLVTVLNLLSGETVIFYLKITDDGVNISPIKKITKDFYMLVNDSGKVKFFNDVEMYLTKEGVAERVECNVSFESSYVYPRSGTISLKAYDIFGNETYARIAVKLKSPNTVFDDGSTVKIVRFYPNNELKLNFKLLYSSVVNIETDIIEVLT